MAHKSDRFLPLLWLAGAAMVLLTVYAVRAVNPVNEPVLQPEQNARTLSGAAGPLDLNTATADELEALPGIGPVLAESILARREENGPFLSEEDILAVPGIGPDTCEAIHPFITY